MPAEIGAALGILLPSIVCYAFLTADVRASTWIASLGCMAHCPFSFMLHMHRAFSSDAVTRTWLYKLDASFIHVHSVLTGYSWGLRHQLTELIYHACSILHIYFALPLQNPNVKKVIDILAGLGAAKSSFGMAFRSLPLWACAVSFWVVLFSIHHKKLAGSHSSLIMHIMLAVPQYCMLRSLQYHEPYWGQFKR